MGPGRPDVASSAGIYPLDSDPDSDQSTSDLEMDDRGGGQGNKSRLASGGRSLVNKAQDALLAANPFPVKDKGQATKTAGRPKMNTMRGKAQNKQGEGATQPLAGRASSQTSVDPSSTLRFDSTGATGEGPASQASQNGPVQPKDTSAKTSAAGNGVKEAIRVGAGRANKSKAGTIQNKAPVAPMFSKATLAAPHAATRSSARTHPSASSTSAAEKQHSTTLDTHLKKLADAAADSVSDEHMNDATPNPQAGSASGGAAAVSQGSAAALNGQYAPTQTSPMSTFSDNSAQGAFGLSPPPGPGNPGSHPYYFPRRPSQVSENGTSYPPPQQPEGSYPPPPPGPDGGLNGEVYGPGLSGGLQDPGMEIDLNRMPGSLEGQHGGTVGAGGFKCDNPGCQAAPFQTQYLLNSHANVHSQKRPHYCPVKGCPRAEGGKGFKRKNEMIRHGLVHDSPGYICPFCPDREHRYPRPDNLQRHVRVHHNDKQKDDPALRDVLSQRPEGGNRGRRRRLGQ